MQAEADSEHTGISMGADAGISAAGCIRVGARVGAGHTGVSMGTGGGISAIGSMRVGAGVGAGPSIALAQEVMDGIGRVVGWWGSSQPRKLADTY